MRRDRADLTARTIPGLVQERARQWPAAPAHFIYENAEWQPSSWSDYASRVRRAARAFIALGMEPGETVALVAPSRQEWAIFAVGAMTARLVPAGVFPTFPKNDIRRICRETGARIVLADTAELAELASGRADDERAPRVVSLADDALPPEGGLTWEQFMAQGDEAFAGELAWRTETLQPDDVAAVAYSVGTTGTPRGARLTHDNLYFTASTAAEHYGMGPRDRHLSYLSTALLAEQLFALYMPAVSGHAVYFSRGPERLGPDLHDIHPTVFIGVPRIWDRFQSAIEQRMASSWPPQRLLFQQAVRAGKGVRERHASGDASPVHLRVRHSASKWLVHRKMRAALGLDASRAFVNVAAPAPTSVLDFFAGLGMPILDMYGQVEASGITTLNAPGDSKTGTSGKPLRETEIARGEGGELAVRGRHVFAGFLDQERDKAPVTHDGWLATGDTGTFDYDGNLILAGRKRELIVTATGHDIVPEAIEARIRAHPLVLDAVVAGHRQRFLVALVTLDDAAAQRFARQRGIDGEPRESPEIERTVAEAIEAANAAGDEHEQVVRFRILPRALNVDEGELTPTLEVRRHVVLDRYAAEIAALYAESGHPVAAAGGN